MKVDPSANPGSQALTLPKPVRADAPNFAEMLAQNLFHAEDKNGDGSVTRDEFVASQTQSKSPVTKEYAEQAFSGLDLNQAGSMNEADFTNGFLSKFKVGVHSL